MRLRAWGIRTRERFLLRKGNRRLSRGSEVSLALGSAPSTCVAALAARVAGGGGTEEEEEAEVEEVVARGTVGGDVEKAEDFNTGDDEGAGAIPNIAATAEIEMESFAWRLKNEDPATAEDERPATTCFDSVSVFRSMLSLPVLLLL